MRAHPKLTASAVVLSLGILGVAPPGHAAWPHDPNNGNVALCIIGNNQYNPTIVSDGAGGAIVTWQDQRSATTYDIYALELEWK